MLEDYRKKWLKVRREYPDLIRQELMKKVNFLYLWLQRNDFEWLNQNLPEVVKKTNRKNHLDWNEIDKSLSVKAEYACEEILSYSGKPVRCSITEIIKRVGNKTWIEKRKTKLPLTTKVIDKFLEEQEDYMIRKVKWAENEFLKEQRIPTRLQLTVKAVVRNKTAASAKVRKAIDNSLKRLERNSKKY